MGPPDADACPECGDVLFDTSDSGQLQAFIASLEARRLRRDLVWVLWANLPVFVTAVVLVILTDLPMIFSFAVYAACIWTPIALWAARRVGPPARRSLEAELISRRGWSGLRVARVTIWAAIVIVDTAFIVYVLTRPTPPVRLLNACDDLTEAHCSVAERCRNPEAVGCRHRLDPWCAPLFPEGFTGDPRKLDPAALATFDVEATTRLEAGVSHSQLEACAKALRAMSPDRALCSGGAVLPAACDFLPEAVRNPGGSDGEPPSPRGQ